MSGETDQHRCPRQGETTTGAEPAFPGSLLPGLALDRRLRRAFRGCRMMSLLLSLLLFLALSEDYSFLSRLGLIACLTASAALLVYLYESYRNNSLPMLLLILAEVSGIAFLLACTGGLQSPFVFYAINPFLLAATFLPLFLPWLYLVLFFLVSTAGALYLGAGAANPEGLLRANGAITAVLAVVVIIMQIFSRLHLLQAEKSNQKSLQQKEG